MNEVPLIAVVDDDESVRESLPDLLRVFGYDVEAFSSAEEYLASDNIDATDCLVLDIAMPGMTGPELASELADRGKIIPKVFITANRYNPSLASFPSSAKVLMKPFGDDELRTSVEAALAGH